MTRQELCDELNKLLELVEHSTPDTSPKLIERVHALIAELDNVDK